jgi:NAD(P)-dependent dehydrogenase (short-subunit alcohol dehydrogenase family)
LITGANKGIGLQVGRELAAKGFTAFVGLRDLGRGEAAAKEVGSGAVAIQLDVCDGASIESVAKRIRNDFGHLDLLVNNAAITGHPAGMTLPEFAKISRASVVSIDHVRDVWETNVFGALAVTQAMLPLLRSARGASIVNVSSGLASLSQSSVPSSHFQLNFNVAYAASKTALNAITLAFAIELESEGIAVNAVSPGFTKTAINNYQGTQTITEGAREIVRVALLGSRGASGKFTRRENERIPW